MAMDYSSAHNDWRENSYAPGTSPEDFKPNMTDIEIGKVVHDIVHEPVDMDTGRVENALLAKHTTEPTSLEDPNAQPGVCGLRNLGNTCYMNAGIQALLSVPQLTEHFTDALLSDLDEWPRGTEEPESRGLDRILEQVDTLLYNAYTKLIRSVWSGRYTYLTPTAFKAFIGEAFHPFRGYKAHDCQEFMGVFLDHINAVLRADRLRHSSLREESDSEPSTKSPKLEKNSVCASAYGSDTPTVVESAFRGKFSTKVTCCECRHETVLEEPFFFLSVPLPRGFERQFNITWCPLNPVQAETDPLAPDGTTIPVTECLVTVFKNQNVSDLKKALLQLLALDLSPADIALIEVSGRAPQRLLQDSLVVSYVKDDFRSVYAVEMKVTPSTSLEEGVSSPVSTPGEQAAKKPLISSINGVVSSSPEADKPMDSQEMSVKENGKTDTPVNPASLSYHTCAICLEDIQDTDLMVHPACGCTLCETCLSLNCSRVTESGDTPCPVCSEAITTESFIPYPQLQSYRPETKRIPAFVIFRHRLPTDTSGSGLRLNKLQPFSHPCLMEVDNHLKGYQLYSWVTELPRPALFQKNESFEICLTDDLQDTRRVQPDFSDVIIRPSDRIYVDFGLISASMVDCSDKKKFHMSLVEEKREPLTLSNCLDAFSQSEILGPENMWFCPMCQDNKSVEKFIRIKELPTTLIVHLKRFAFHGSQGDKIDAPVNFPFSAADFNSYVFSSSPCDAGQVPEYDLIGCVCHFGGLHGGHYTAYTKHPTTHEWLHYNDHKVEAVNPEAQTDTAKEAYILIYQRSDNSAPRLQAAAELTETEEEKKLVRLIIDRIQREEAASVLYGPAPAPVTGPSSNPFLKDTYMIDFEEFSADYYPDNPSIAQVTSEDPESAAEGVSRVVCDSAGTLDGAASTCDSSQTGNNIPDQKIQVAQGSSTGQPDSMNIVWDHIV